MIDDRFDEPEYRRVARALLGRAKGHGCLINSENGRVRLWGQVPRELADEIHRERHSIQAFIRDALSSELFRLADDAEPERLLSQQRLFALDAFVWSLEAVELGDTVVAWDEAARLRVVAAGESRPALTLDEARRLRVILEKRLCDRDRSFHAERRRMPKDLCHA